MRDPLLPPAAAMIVGIMLSRLVDFSRMELAAAIVAFTVLSLVARRSSRRLAVACALLAAMGVGSLIAVLGRPRPRPTLDVTPGEIALIGGCVVDPPVFSDDREQFVLELAPQACARVSLYVKEGKPPELRYGQLVELEARVRTPRNFNNPGSFDYAGYLERQDIYWLASARSGTDIRILPGACGSRWLSAIYSFRTRILDRIENLYGRDAYSSSMMRAILLGESSRLEKSWKKAGSKISAGPARIMRWLSPDSTSRYSRLCCCSCSGSASFLLRQPCS